MSILGLNALIDQELHPLWDLDEMKKVQLADGASFDAVLQEVAAALGLLNSDLIGMEHLGQLLAYQDNVTVEYGTGSSENRFKRSDEYTPPDAYLAELTGHSLPIYSWDGGLGWTRRALRSATRTQIEANVRAVATDAKDLWQKQILERLFSNAVAKVGKTAGASIPLCDGGTADSTYIPPRSPKGETFNNTHLHYLRLNGLTTANLLTAVKHMTEHGHTCPLEMLISEADAAAWKTAAGTDWKAPTWNEINYQASATERAGITDVSTYIGFIETSEGIVRVWSSPRVPTKYWGLYKAYGAGDPRSTLRMRINPLLGFGYQVVPGIWANAPISIGVVEVEFGIGIGQDRTNGVLVYNEAAGDYVVPTIT